MGDGVSDDELVERLRAMVCATLRVDPERVTLDVSLLELGADSLDLTQLVLDIEEAFGVTIPESDAPKLLTLRGAAAYLRGEAAATSTTSTPPKAPPPVEPSRLAAAPIAAGAPARRARRARDHDTRVGSTGIG
ncbi:MAG TPA: acyl carrier protein, partial [Labilithrix sp.]|nr:acyl carrier protein [Labilithrix sp.]